MYCETKECHYYLQKSVWSGFAWTVALKLPKAPSFLSSTMTDHQWPGLHQNYQIVTISRIRFVLSMQPKLELKNIRT